LQSAGRGAHKKAAKYRLGNIGLVLGTVSYKFSDPFWSVVFNGVDRETTRRGYHLRFAFTLDDLNHEHQEILLEREHIDGLILVGGHDSVLAIESLSEWLSDADARARTVIIDGGDERFYRKRPLEYDVVTFEKRFSMYQLVDHLITLGHRHLAFLGPGSDIDERGAAFVHALACHDLPFDPHLYVESPWSTEGSYAAAQLLLNTGRQIDAVVCGCDAIAISVMRVARELGLHLPNDLAIAGFDDIEFAQHTHPALTTIRVEKEQLGEIAVRKLIERLMWPDLPPVMQVIPTALVVRESCGELA
jgi:LacI family transcriptional regulator